MTKPFHRLLLAALLLALLGATPAVQSPAQAAPPEAVTWKPRTVNAPYFAEQDLFADKFPEMAITWFGKVTSTENYADVRVGYNDLALWVHVSVFDRLVWYDPAHVASKLTSYDGLSLFLNTGALGSTTLTPQTYRFDAQMSWFEDVNLYQAASRGKGTAWAAENITFYHTRGYAGGNFNNGKENRGYAIGFVIPFTSLGLDGPPPDATQWGFGLALRDRDLKPGGAMQPTKLWPETLSAAKPSTWGRVNFGQPVYTPAPSTGGGTVVVQHKLDGQTVMDGGVGGGMNHLCDASAVWTKWGAYNFTKQDSAVIQNQSNLHDWPCFAKLYISFPLTKVPTGKVIVSAKLILHTWGGSDWTQAQPSLIQVSTVRTSWTETGLTWNSAPIPQENVAQTWVNPVDHVIQSSEWPGWRYEWDVSAAVAQAYAGAIPLRIALYEADNAYHSGKYFTTSEAGDWNAAGRPTLEIVWGDK